MKRISVIIACFLCVTSVWGQGFIKAEYFFDADRGVNNGTAITPGTTSDTVNFTAVVSTASLSAGFHFLGSEAMNRRMQSFVSMTIWRDKAWKPANFRRAPIKNSLSSIN